MHRRPRAGGGGGGGISVNGDVGSVRLETAVSDSNRTKPELSAAGLAKYLSGAAEGNRGKLSKG